MNESSLPAPVEKDLTVITALAEKLLDVDDSTACLESFNNLDNVLSELNSLESAKLNVALAYCLANLYFVQMNIAGKDATGHPIHEVLNRIKETMTIVISKEAQTASAGADQPQEKKQKAAGADGKPSKKIKVDPNAASRVIRHHIS